MLNNIAVIAAREFKEMVKTKAFIIGAILMPVLLVVFFGFSILLQTEEPEGEKKMAVVDYTGRLYDSLADEARKRNERKKPEDAENPESGEKSEDLHKMKFTLEEEDAGSRTKEEVIGDLTGRVTRNELFAFAVIGSDVVTDEGRRADLESKVEYFTNSPTYDDLPRWFGGTVNSCVKKIWYEEKKVDPEVIRMIQHNVPLTRLNLAAGEKAPEEIDSTVAFLTPMAFMVLLFMGVFTCAAPLLTSVIEEKSNRIVEILLSSVTPFELMAGKILGLAAVGLTLMVLWGGGGYVAASWKGFAQFIEIENVGHFIGCFIFGFLMWGGFYAAIGAACNTLKEAQSLMGPIGILLWVPWFTWFFVVQNPDSTLSLVLTYIPLLTPFMLILRMAVPPGPSLIEITLAYACMAGTTLLILWCAGRIFRTGILMYGKPPRLRELLRWIRAA